MSTEDSPDSGEGGPADERGDVRDRLEREADRAIEQFDEGVVDLLSWVLDTETRARIYIYLRKHPESTSDEVARGTGLYPSTVREALAAFHAEGKVSREKREASGAGNNPYEYSAMAPSDLVGDVVEDIQRELNTVFNLDRYISDDGTDREGDDETDAVTITVADELPGPPETEDGELTEDGTAVADGNGPDAPDTDLVDESTADAADQD